MRMMEVIKCLDVGSGRVILAFVVVWLHDEVLRVFDF